MISNENDMAVVEKTDLNLEMILNSDDGMTMSSKDIADLVGKAHSHVCKDIRLMMIQSMGGKTVVDVPEDISYSQYIKKNATTIFEIIIRKDERNCVHQELQGLTWEKDKRNYIKEFHLDGRLTVNLVTGYDPVLRQKVVDEWMDLARSKNEKALVPSDFDPAVFNTPEFFLEVSNTIKERNALRIEVKESKEKCGAYDLVTTSEGSGETFTNSAKYFNLGVKKFKNILYDIKFLKDGRKSGRVINSKHDFPMQKYINDGCVEVLAYSFKDNFGRQIFSKKVIITPKGLMSIARMMIAKQENISIRKVNKIVDHAYAGQIYKLQ